ncbi:hypothetical protein RBA41_19125 [Massilia sp. CCM 9210]|uniref:MmyB family transcriptional regulator n=1 Tax=Massilia scottii TaxID=3057166 RepID=UPI002796D0DC|nr:hypothetical protein [Massilia sp. CCM 9210]MDQ1815417.1 hypothetical protein [Massilia sp. CCM 9210]
MAVPAIRAKATISIPWPATCPPWEAVCADALHWIQREAMGDGPGSEATSLLAELAALPGIDAIGTAAHAPNLDRRALPFLPLTIRKDDVELNVFTTITTMGTPHDVTVHELRIESFFPADERSKAWFTAKNVALRSRGT